MHFSRMALVFPVAALAACSGAQSSLPTASTSSELTGPIEVRLDNVEEVNDLAPVVSAATKVVVTITRIDARVGVHGDGDDGGWRTIVDKTETVDLLSLNGGSFASLGIGTLPAGNLEQLRLFVSETGPNYVMTADGVTHALIVPSSEIRIVGDFDTESCATGHVTLDFEGRHSIVVAPDEGQSGWILRPVVRLGEVVAGCPAGDDDDPPGGRGDQPDRR
jgi:uncharacterized protein DUF4382